jgi:hypothetical protein
MAYSRPLWVAFSKFISNDAVIFVFLDCSGIYVGVDWYEVKIIVDKRFQFGGEKGSQGSSSLTAKVFSCDRHLRDDIQSITTFSGAAKQISLSLWQRWEREITMMMLSRFRSYMRSSRVYTPWVSGTTCAIKSRFLLRSHFTACLFGFFHSEVLCDRGRFPLPS